MGHTVGVLCSLLLWLLVLQNGCEGARFLCLSHQFGSHMLMVHSMAEGLIERGHEVYTVFSDMMTVPKGLEEKGFKILRYHTPEGSNTLSNLGGNSTKMVEDLLAGRAQPTAEHSACALMECNDIDNDAILQKQINDLNIDMALVVTFPLSSCLTFQPLRSGVPFVVIPPAVDMELMRTPALPSFIPAPILLSSHDMSFIERVKNLLITLMLSVPAISPFTAVKDVSLLKKYNKDPNVNSWKDLTRKAELFLLSRGPVLEYPCPLTPNVINVECLTCKPAKPLDADVESVIANASGVIVVSFGSLIAEFPDHLAEKLLKAFAKRAETIFWRYKGKLPGNIPANVKVMKWLPQNDLLAHPKTKLFITHSGNNGQYESIYHGVPMLAFPLFGDQPHNGLRIEVHGYGLQADIRTFTTHELAEKTAELIDNPTYRHKTQKAGNILKAAPMDARQAAVYWIEHVLEFGGEHLRTHGMNMPWYSFYMIDILLISQAILIILIHVLVKFCCCVRKCVCASKRKEKTS